VNFWKWLWRGVLAGMVAAVLSLAALLIYYRPTIEYAYVDILDRREHPTSGWFIALLAASVALLVGGALVWLKRKAAQRG
jgi:cell division protein FtsX